MKKKIFLVFVVVFIIAGVVLAVRFLAGGSEDTWICSNGLWVKHGAPAAEKPDEGCGQVKDEMIKVFSPESDQLVSLPIKIEGEARGNWFFEASFPIELLDANGNALGLTIGQAKSNWMTADFVPFEATINLKTLPETETGTLVLRRDNPSGLPENDSKITLPIRFPKSEETDVVKVFFNNENLDPEFSCNKVFPVNRVVSKTPAIARTALELLLGGPTFAEEEEKFFTSINSGVKIQKLTIENGVAKVDFDEQMEFQIGGSCRVSAIRAQITETLKQFPTVQSVIISVNGRTEDILQP
ncbi:MAG: GerMN domain-containing protein [bacterium]|nr:GerMN domain-containing protein [bacterium]